MSLEAQRRLERFVALLACPPVAALSWSLGLKLAGVGLLAVWALLVIAYIVDYVRHPEPASVAPATTERPQQPPPAVDPAQALLQALGSDLTDGAR